METWAIDLDGAGAIYPWQGAEGIMVLVAVVLWLAWHVWQMKAENKEFSEDIAKYGTDDKIRQALDKHP